jgi:hypothetical protein
MVGVTGEQRNLHVAGARVADGEMSLFLKEAFMFTCDNIKFAQGLIKYFSCTGQARMT